ncbi:MAG: metal ABC transporter permease [Weeksellaceae bacterium]|nr:metal ABC transporter permease [Weeksellaceae bacterium]
MDWLVHISFWWLAVGTLFLGAACGIAGVLALLQKQSLMGDAVSHAAFPGIVLAFIILQTKTTLPLLAGAAVIGLFGNYLVNHIMRNSKLKTDAALGIVLSAFFGFGMLLYSYVPQLKLDTQAGLERFLFGQAATLLEAEVYWIVAWFAMVLVLVSVFFKEIKLTLFDDIFASSIGIPVRRMKAAMGIVVVISIVTGLQAAGVILISTLLLAPAAIAKQWSESLQRMFVVAGLTGGFGSVLGLVISIWLVDLPTGPVIVVVLSILVMIALLTPIGRRKTLKNNLNAHPAN